MEILDLKNTMAELKNSIKSFTRTFDKAVESVSLTIDHLKYPGKGTQRKPNENTKINPTGLMGYLKIRKTI
jgi:hypothetical protein